MMSEETNDFKPLADADDATSQQPVTAAADYPATGAVAGTAATQLRNRQCRRSCYG